MRRGGALDRSGAGLTAGDMVQMEKIFRNQCWRHAAAPTLVRLLSEEREVM